MFPVCIINNMKFARNLEIFGRQRGVFTSMVKDSKQKTISCQMHGAGGAYGDYGSLRSCVPRHVHHGNVLALSII